MVGGKKSLKKQTQAEFVTYHLRRRHHKRRLVFQSSIVWCLVSGRIDVILLMEEILHHLGCKKLVDNGINCDKLHIHWLAGFLPSTVIYSFLRRIQHAPKFPHSFFGRKIPLARPIMSVKVSSCYFLGE